MRLKRVRAHFDFYARRWAPGMNKGAALERAAKGQQNTWYA